MKNKHEKDGAIACAVTSFSAGLAVLFLSSGCPVIGSSVTTFSVFFFIGCLRSIILEATTKDKE